MLELETDELKNDIMTNGIKTSIYGICINILVYLFVQIFQRIFNNLFHEN